MRSKAAKKVIRINIRLKTWHKYLFLTLLPLLGGFITYVTLINLPGVSRKLLQFSTSSHATTLASLYNVLAIIISTAIVLAIGLYVYIDYKIHAKPLKIEDPYVPYTLKHHTKVVILPLVRYRKKQISFTLLYPLVTILVLGLSVGLSLQKVLAAVPTVTTNTATSVTTSSATLNGSVSSDGGNPITARGFEYGLDANYGQSIDLVASSISYVRDSTFSLANSSDGAFYSYASPTGIATDSHGDVYVVDTGNHRIQKFDSTGNFILKWGSLGSDDGQFSSPEYVAVDSTGYVYAPGNLNVQKFDNYGNFILKWGSNGTGDGQFTSMKGLAVDSLGNVFVAENRRVQKFTSNGVYILKWGTYGGYDGQFDGVMGIAVDPANYVFTTERFNQRIQKFTNNGGYIASWSGNSEYLTGIATGPSNKIYVTHQEQYSGLNRVVKYTDYGVFETSWGCEWCGNGQLKEPQGIATNSLGEIYVTNNATSVIQKFDSSGNFIARWGSYGSNNGQFKSPSDIAVDNTGNVYVVDTINNRIQKFDSSGGYLTQWGNLGSGDGQFNSPRGITTDSSGDVYVADTFNHRIQKFDSNGGYITKWGSNGTGNGQFNSPHGITTDSSENVYVADTYNHRIQKFDSNGGYITKWGAGEGNGSSGSGSGEFNEPRGLAMDLDGRLVVSDSLNLRIQIFDNDGSHITNMVSFGGYFGNYSAPYSIAINKMGQLFVVGSWGDGWYYGIYKYQSVHPTGSFLAQINNLECGTTYHFRAYATNANGTSYGNDETFTTSSCTSATIPGPPENFVVTGTPPLQLITHNSVAVQWDAPADDGGSSITGYILEYKKHTDSSWTSAGTYNATQLSELIGPLDELTEYDFRVAATNAIGNGPYATLSATTVDGGATHTVSSCEDLRKIDFDLLGTYNLTHDIECADYNDWLSEGLNIDGFAPIGLYSDDGYGFRGTLNGNGYKIKNLKIDATQSPYQGTLGLFSITTGAKISNLQLKDINYDISGIGYVGGVIGYALRTGLTNVSTTGTIDATVSDPSSSLTVGGLGGTFEIDSELHKVYSTVALTINQQTGSESSTIFAGGLAGRIWAQGGDLGDITPPIEWQPEYPVPTDIVSAHVHDAYFTGSISVTGFEDATTQTYVGGVSAVMTQGIIENTYFAGSIVAASTNALTSGIVLQAMSGPSQNNVATTIRNSFVAGSIINSGQINPYAGFRKIPVGASINAGSPYAVPVITGNYYDNTALSDDYCFFIVEMGGPVPYGNTDDGKCAAVNTDGSQSNYFKNNKTNGPLGHWDFSTPVWYVQSNDYPKFVAGAVTPPANPPTNPPANPPSSPTNTTKPKTPKPKIPPTTAQTPQISNSPGGPISPLEALTPRAAVSYPEKVKAKKISLFAQVAPFFFLSWLLLIALAYALKSWQEYRRTRAIQAVLMRYKMLSQDIHSFISIIAHYLNTPITIMESSLELLQKSHSVLAGKDADVMQKLRVLMQFSASMQSNQQQQTQLEPNQSTATVREVPLERRQRLLSQKSVWIPILGVAICVAVTDIVLTVTGSYRWTDIRMLNQLVFFGLGTILLLVALYLHRRQKELISEQQHLLQTEQTLLKQQTTMLGSSATELNHYTNDLQTASQPLVSIPEAKTFNNGLSMMQKLNSALLFAQEVSSATDAPPAISLSGAVEQVLLGAKQAFADKKLSVLPDIPQSISVNISPDHLQYLLRSILDNAIHFSKDGSSITVRAHTTRRFVVIKISDQGQGMDKQQLDNLFTPFSRGTEVETYNTEGLGLGLYNCKLLVDSLGGKLELKSKVNAGTVVTIALPQKSIEQSGQAGIVIMPAAKR